MAHSCAPVIQAATFFSRSGRILLVLVALAIAVSGCAPRGPLTVMPEAAEIGSPRPIFVATSRDTSSDSVVDLRSEVLSHRRYEISVPPNRVPGSIRLPRSPPDPSRDFVATSVDEFGGANAFVSSLRRELRELPRAEREVILYVHGFNNTLAEGVLRVAQLGHDLNLPGIGVHYSWPSAANPLGYAYDQDSALFARDGLERLIANVRRAGANRITVVAHSMGGFLTMETLRQMAIARPGSVHRAIDAVVLISPDIDIDVFKIQARRIGRLPDEFVIFTSKRDRALTLAARLTGQAERLGNIRDSSRISDLRVTLIDVTAFSEGIGHFSPGSSPALLRILGQVASVDAAFERDRAGRTGILPGTVLTVQNVTEIILSPISVATR